MTETLSERLLRHEGLKLFPYKDSLGFPTIGVGHLITAQDGDQFDAGITYADAMKLLETDIAQCIQQADSYILCYHQLDTVRQDIIVEMIFQLGINAVLTFHNMLFAIASGDWAKAAYEMVNSKWHGQTTARSDELAHIMLTGMA